MLVYSVLIGAYDKPSQLLGVKDAVLITDQKGVANWQIIPHQSSANSKRAASIAKISATTHFPDATASLYIDANVQFKPEGFAALVSVFDASNKDLLFFSHPQRKCLYKEAIAIAASNKDKRGATAQQAEDYKKRGCPVNAGLVCGGVFFRRHTQQVKEFERIWLSEYVAGDSIRDQLSLAFTLWRTGIDYGVIPGNYFRNQFFVRGKHHRG